jgi:flagellar hook-associated protein FlgK
MPPMPSGGSLLNLEYRYKGLAMKSASVIAQSGMHAAQQRQGASAHNIANVQTDNFRRQEVVQQSVAEGGVKTSTRKLDVTGEALTRDLVEQKSASYAFLSNLKVIQTEKQMMGRLLDERA